METVYLEATFLSHLVAIFADLRRREAELGARLVRQSQARPVERATRPAAGRDDLPGDAHSAVAG
jgi:hypothetical protein